MVPVPSGLNVTVTSDSRSGVVFHAQLKISLSFGVSCPFHLHR